MHAGLGRLSEAIVHPWVKEAQDKLNTSNVLNVYGPFRHGKTSLMQIASGCLEPERDAKYTFVRYFRPSGMPTLQTFTADVLAGLPHGVRKQPHYGIPENVSADEAANILLKELDCHFEIERSQSGKEMRIMLDEMQPYCFDPEFRLFFPKFISEIRKRPHTRLVVNTLYPVSAWNEPDYNCLTIPEVRVGKWARPTLDTLFDRVLHGISREYGEKFGVAVADKRRTILDAYWKLAGGTPDLIARMIEDRGQAILSCLYHGVRRFDVSMFEEYAEYMFDDWSRKNLRALALAHPTERKAAINLFRELAKGEIFAPHTALDHAVAMHLLISGGVGETPDGHLISSGSVYDGLTTREPTECFVVPSLDALMERHTDGGIRLEPYMRQRCAQPSRQRTHKPAAPMP